MSILIVIIFILCLAYGVKAFGSGRLQVIKNKSPVQVSMSGNVAHGISRNQRGDLWVPQRTRPRRNRASKSIRALVQENEVTVKDLVYPLFIHDDNDKASAIASMPGCYRHSLNSMMKEVDESVRLGIMAFILFPKIPNNLKSNDGEEAYNPNGIVPRAIKLIKDKYPDVLVCTDVALDPYSAMGHDGIVRNGKIVNDLSINSLVMQAVMQAKAGADIVAPSDMMDGRIGAIRDALDHEGFVDVGILAYTAKYASAFYGPFRDALDSHPGFGDKKTYQQDPANGREALLEAALDSAEGADILLVKPGMPYLDIIHRLRESTDLPIAAYQVSGEYSMIKAASEKGWLNEKDAVMESLMSFKRAGADIILTYFAKQIAGWIHK